MASTPAWYWCYMPEQRGAASALDHVTLHERRGAAGSLASCRLVSRCQNGGLEGRGLFVQAARDRLRCAALNALSVAGSCGTMHSPSAGGACRVNAGPTSVGRRRGGCESLKGGPAKLLPSWLGAAYPALHVAGLHIPAKCRWRLRLPCRPGETNPISGAILAPGLTFLFAVS